MHKPTPTSDLQHGTGRDTLFRSMLAALVMLSGLSHALDTPRSPCINTLNVRDMTIGELVALLSYGGAAQTVASQEAAKESISIFLQNIDPAHALEAICRSAGLVYRPSADGVSFILTQQEFSASRGLYNDEVVECIQLRFATALDVGETLRNLFADRLVWVAPSSNVGDAEQQINNALSRMDLLTDYEEFRRDGTTVSDDENDEEEDDHHDRSSTRSGSTVDLAMLDRYRTLLDEQRLMPSCASDESTETLDLARFGIVFVSAQPTTNMILLRSTDSRALEQIKMAVNALDRPSPQVLLEVKVLELNLGNGKSTGIDWLLQAADAYAGSSKWNDNGIGTVPGEGAGGGLESTIANHLPSTTGFNLRPAAIGIISEHLMARMRFMESQGRLTQLATPSLLVADDEASRVFIGSQSQFLKKVRRSAVVISEGGQTSGGELTPDLNDQSIGMNLLITPRIHADRSVTLRVLQEDTDFGQTRAINYGGQEPVEVQDIQHRSVVSTIVAYDGNWVVIGGLLREGISEKESGIPILKEIPILGRVFKNTGTCQTRSELIIMIRPTVLVAPGDDVDASQALLNRVSRHPAVNDILDHQPVELSMPTTPSPPSPDSRKGNQRNDVPDTSPRDQP